MNRVDRVSRIFVVARDGVDVIANVRRVLAGGGVNVEPMNAEVMGNEVTVILTRDCYDHARAC